jgi:MarR family transcriptional regulator, organic hydroperoxide resistance regulator
MPITSHEELGHLMGSVCRLHHTRADQSMEQIGLYRGQAILLMILSRHDGITHSEIAEKLRVSPAAATKVIKRMEGAGYVQRQADPADERVSRVFLQDEGRALIAEIEGVFGVLDRAMFAGLSEADLVRFRDLLTQMAGNLQRFQP